MRQKGGVRQPSVTPALPSRRDAGTAGSLGPSRPLSGLLRFLECSGQLFLLPELSLSSASARGAAKIPGVPSPVLHLMRVADEEIKIRRTHCIHSSPSSSLPLWIKTAFRNSKARPPVVLVTVRFAAFHRVSSRAASRNFVTLPGQTQRSVRELAHVGEVFCFDQTGLV